MIKEKCLRHKIKVCLDIGDIPETIKADERKIKQIMYNLLSNAVKFTPDGGTVGVKANVLKCKDAGQGIKSCGSLSDSKKKGNCLRVRVEDSGIGIRNEDLERIFEPFEQVENSRSRRFQGTGLGLSLTRQLVELHGGCIWAESQGEGKGSIFTFLIPVV